MPGPFPLSGLRVLELGSRVAVPYLAKLFTDAGANVVKVESPAGDPFRCWSASGADIPAGDDGAWFRFLNGGKQSVVVDLETGAGRLGFLDLVGRADLVLDDHRPAHTRALGIHADQLRAANPRVVVATLTCFGTTGPWADRPANDFTLQALVGATDGRGVPGEEPVACGGDLGDFVTASLSAPAVLAATLGARAAGRGVHLDVSRYESMMLAFQTYRPIYEEFAPDFRPGRQIEIPSVEPAADGEVGYCTITGQQWQDFCAMIGAPDMAEDPELSNFHGRMHRRDEVWSRIRDFTTQHSVNELVELAAQFRIPAGPIGTGDVVTGFDQFLDRGVFVENAHGFTQPRPPYQFSASQLAPLRPAPRRGEGSGFDERARADELRLGATPERPLSGMRVLDLSAFWAGPLATNLLRLLGAALVKVESHARLDGMRWSSGLDIPLTHRLWEWSPVYHGANVGKTVVNLDLGTEPGRELLLQLVAEADLVVENYSPRVAESWGLTWERIQELNPRACYVRMPAFGTSGPWRDRVGFAMTMEQVSGLASRTGHPDGPPLVPKGPVDPIAGMHAAFAAILALVERDRIGRGQLVELPLIEGALQAAAEQVVEYTAYGGRLTRQGNRSPGAAPQGLYRTCIDDSWVAISVENDEQWRALIGVVDGLDGWDRHEDATRIDAVINRWTESRHGAAAAAALWKVGVPAASCVHVNDSGRTSQHEFRRFLQWRRHPVTGWTPYLSYPFQLDGRHLDLGEPAPVLGQHTGEVLRALGLTDDGIHRLRSEGITGDWPAGVPRDE